MSIDIGDEAREIIRRLGAVDRTAGIVDHARAEDALQRHLAALNLAPMPIRWVIDAKSGLMVVASAAWSVATNVAENAAQNAVRRAARNAALSVATSVVSSAAFSAAESAAESAAFFAGFMAANIVTSREANSVACNAAWSAGSIAAQDNNIAVWLPFVDAYEAGLGQYWVMGTEIVAVPRPLLMISDDRLHCQNGPAVSWPEGAKFWFWRGRRVSQQIIEAPETLTIKQIDTETNTEVRRIMIERFGAERYIREGKAKLIASDPVHGDLYRKRRKHDTDIVMLHVRNNTIEPDGTVREFWIRVHPECRPFRARDKWIGDPQIMTPLNARASTWGLTGEVFRHLAEAS